MRIHHATAAKAKKFQITLIPGDKTVAAISLKTGDQLAHGTDPKEVLEAAITKATGKAAKGAVKAPVARVAKAKAAVTDPFEAAAKAEGWKKTRWGFRNEDGGDCPSDITTWQVLCESAEIEIEQDEADDEDGEGQSKSVVKAKYKAKYKPTKNRCGDELSHRMNEHCSREDDDGEVKINLDALRKFAKANGVWVESYASFKSRVGTFNGGMAMMNVNNRLRAKLRKIAKEEEREFDIDKDISWK